MANGGWRGPSLAREPGPVCPHSREIMKFFCADFECMADGYHRTWEGIDVNLNFSTTNGGQDQT